MRRGLSDGASFQRRFGARRGMERKTIAVFISALYEDMVRETVEGLLSAARGENM